jgi:hypothetical protein
MDVPETPWKQAKANLKSRRQESRLAKLPGGRAQVNSGRTWFSKRDVRLGGFLVEARTTAKGSYTISRDEFLHVQRDALGTPPGQLPAMQVDFEGEVPLHLFVMRLSDHLDREAYIATLEAKLKEK